MTAVDVLKEQLASMKDESEELEQVVRALKKELGGKEERLIKIRSTMESIERALSQLVI